MLVADTATHDTPQQRGGRGRTRILSSRDRAELSWDSSLGSLTTRARPTWGFRCTVAERCCAGSGAARQGQALVLVEWRDRAALDTFLADPELADLHPLRQNGTHRYIWWMFDRLEDLRPLLRN